MAKFVPFLGNISGKLKSVVFAYNKGGSYIRSWRASTKPLSTSQLDAQALFASAVTSWHALNDTIKGAWNTFATSTFKPKNPVSGVAYSGYNSFVSLKNEADNMALKVNVIIPSIPVAATFTADFFLSTQTPPDHPLSAMIKDPLGHPLNVMLQAINFSVASNDFDVFLKFLAPVVADISGHGPNFVDAIGDEPVGIAVYGSKPGVQLNQYVENPEFGLLFVTPPIGQIEDWTTSDIFAFTTSLPAWQASRKQQYNIGDIVQAKAYLVGKSGQTQPLNAVKFEVTA